ncbi:MAG: tetratricopeptide repeat protein [Candidatus Kariarchaeaceae archaeon]|jgi:tetratricopeptide (TPR) repeat protein
MDLRNIQQLIFQGKLDIAELEIDKIGEDGILDANLLRCEIFIIIGKYDEAFDLANQVISLSKKTDKPAEELKGYIVQAYALVRMSKYDEAIDALHSTVTVLNTQRKLLELDVIRNIEGTIANLMGLANRYQGNLGKALEYYQNSLEIRKELKLQREEALTTQNIATVFQLKGELETALGFNLYSLNTFEEIGDVQFIAFTLHDIGLIYWMKGDHIQALEYLQKCLKIRTKIHNPFYTIDTLYYLVLLKLELNEKASANLFFEQLAEIFDSYKGKRTVARYKLAKAMILKASDRIIKTAEAQGLFQEIVNYQDVEHELHVFAMLNLYEQLISELKIYKNEEILLEVKALASKLLSIAKDTDSHSLLAETFLLQSKLSLLELDVSKAQYLLTQAEITANEKNLVGLAQKISNEYDTIIDRTKWDTLKKRNASIIERVAESNLDDILANMLTKRQKERFEQIDEKPVLLLVLNDSGITVFNKRFIRDTMVNEQLIGGFLTASSAGMTQALSGQGSIERIKYGDYTLIFKNVEELSFCYVFQGKSYLAIQRLNRFTDQIHKSHTRWKTITAKAPKPKLIENLVNDFVYEIFPNVQ